MAISKAMIVFPLLCFLFSTISTLSHQNTLVCNQTEKRALLSFKHTLFDPAHRLSSWSTHEDCCGWNGVYCHNITEFYYDYYSYFNRYTGAPNYENLMLVIKGKESEYRSILKFVRSIDLSSNDLWGSIPTEISSLSGLESLNLSCNNLMGSIPEKMGSMKALESLDLSRNHLSGEIPQSMKNLSFLSHLNLSYNNFSGRIPSSTQLQSFDAISYIGNAELCGVPLTKNCTEDEDFQGIDVIDENEEGSEIPWFYIGMGLGFIVGFWGVCGALLFKKAWRHAYFQFLYRVKDWVYVAIAIRLNRLQNNLRVPQM